MASEYAAGKPALQERHQIILFGGHGSPTIFSSIAAQRAQDDADRSIAGAILVSRSHAAFLEELLGLEDCPIPKLGLQLMDLQNPKDFLIPPESLQKNPIVQATTLCLYQLLRYIAEVEHKDSRLDASGKRVLETVGVCSGLLPAAVVATSTTTSQLIENGIAAFRLAFWIACRSSIHGHNYEGDRETSGSWLLIVKGLSQTQAEEELESFCVQVKRRVIRLSAILGASMVSVTGPNEDLRSFHEWLGSKATVKYAPVNAWYHGGDQLKSIADDVMQDVENRQIPFPDSRALLRPLRSSYDGSFADKDDLSKNSLARWIISHMLIYPFDWLKTSEAINSTLTPIIASQERFRAQFLSFGPSSEWLLGTFKSRDVHSKFDTMEMSAFQASDTARIPVNHKDDIAIVGMGVHFPKGHGQEELWNTLCNGVVAVSEIPTSRFDASFYHFHDDTNKSRTMSTHHGAFLDDVWKFDNTFFNISPREAKSMDPQQRILLHTAQAALDDAGYVRDSTPTFQRATMGCYVGLATGDYTDNLRDDIDVFYSPGTLRAFHSGRISFVHNLSGPSIVTDTACSASLVSVYQACRALINEDCTAAIAGGVNTISSPDMYLGLSSGHFLSPSGGCRPFDASADGYCRAEGCGVFILKRYSDAIKENDQIYGVIKGIEVNQSGNSHSITHPHSETQTQLFQRLLSRTMMEPSTISVVEAHGTGTQAGDAREVASLKSTFGSSHSLQNPLILSSIKGNIGHAEAASGAASLAKVLLMLRKNIIPRQAGFHELNPRLAGLGDTGIIIPVANREWESSYTRPRRAMVNNFGAAGSNVALLLEENMVLNSRKTSGLDRSSYVFNVSARTAAAHQAYIREYQEYLRDAKTKPHIKDICYTATARREAYGHRFSIACSSIEDLEAKLKNVDVSKREPICVSKSVIFVFSGQGSIYRGMSEGLLNSSAFFRDEVRQCDKIIRDLGFPSFLPYFTRGCGAQGSLSLSEEVVISQCACVALEYSVAKLFISWNVVPTYVVGHSLGEFAALAIAGAISLKDALRVVASRAQMMADKCPAGESGMIACKVSPSTVDRILAFEEQVIPQLAIACKNSSNDCVVSGPLSQLDSFEQICNIKPIKYKRLDVPYGYHSVSMEPICNDLEDLGRSVTWSNPTINIASGVYGRLLLATDCQSGYFAKHARQPVRFAEAIESIGGAQGFKDSICLEIGPHSTLLTILKSIANFNLCPCYPALKKGVDAWSTLNTALSQLFLVIHDVRWREVFADCQPVTVNLPGYPLGGTDFEIPFSEPFSNSSDSTAPSHRETGFTLLPRMSLTGSSGDSLVYETTFETIGYLILGHNVGGTAICPASVCHELVVEAAQIASLPTPGHVWMVSNMSFAHPLIYDSSSPTQKITLRLNKVNDSNTFDAKVTSDEVRNSQTLTYFTATVSLSNPTATKPSRMREAALIQRQSLYFTTIGNHSTLRTRVLYEKIFTRVVRYSKEYHTLQELNISSSNLEGYGTFKLPVDSPTKDYIVHPAFTDTLLHTAGFIANLGVGSDEICICSHVDSVEVLYESLDFGETFTIYCNLFDDVQGSMVADTFALNSAGQIIALCRGMEFKKLRLKAFQRTIQPAVKAEALTVEPMEVAPSSVTTVIPSPTGSETPESPSESRQAIRTKIQNIMCNSCGLQLQDLTSTLSLTALGIDSLLQIEIASALKQAFPGSIVDQDIIAACDTIESLEDTILSQALPRVSSPDGEVRLPTLESKLSVKNLLSAESLMQPVLNKASMLHISKNEVATPLFCFHDGSGQGSFYGRMNDINRTLYAFSDPDYATSNLRPLTLRQMAGRYAATISKSDTPSVILSGWSFGGVVAFEAAHTLHALGFDVKGLILIDSPYPKDHQPLPEKIIRHVLSKIASKSGIKQSTNGDGVKLHLLTEFKANAALLGAYSPPVSRNYIKTVMLQSRDTMDTEALCGVKYDWLSSQRVRAEAIKGWERTVGGGLDVLEIPGNHFEVFDEQHVVELSAQMKSACQIIERLN